MDPAAGISPSPAMQASLSQQEKHRKRIEKARIARALRVPTDDAQVRRDLRTHGLPICLFGEDAYDRRQRLRLVLAEDVVSGVEKTGEQAAKPDTQPKPPHSTVPSSTVRTEEYYTEGSAELQAMRLSLAKSSIRRARVRLRRERERLRDGANDPAAVAELAAVERVRCSATQASARDSRPVCAIDTDADVVVTGNYGGGMAVWDLNGCEYRQAIDTHDARISTVRLVGDVLYSASGDGSTGLHKRDATGNFQLRHRLSGHSGRVTDVVVHPWREGLAATVGADGWLMLWDKERTLCRQESGHSEAYRASFHADGALLATGGTEGGARIWDIRTGRCIMTLTGAHKRVTSTTFLDASLVTGGTDGVIHVWDLRKRRCVKTIAAHAGIVADLALRDDVLYSGGFDGLVRAWAARRAWGCVAAWTGLERVMAVAAGPSSVVAACWDRSWRVWAPED